MDTPRISIENFKGISSLELEVKPFTVLIGPQSVGKSVTAKLLFYFQSLVDEAFVVSIHASDCSIESELLDRFARWLPEPTRKEGKPIVRYFIGEECFSLTHAGQPNSAWEITLPRFLEEEIGRIKREFSQAAKAPPDDDSLSMVVIRMRDQFRERIKERLGARALFNPRFVPAGRSFYAQFEKDAVSFFESATLDPFVAEFGKYLARVKDSQFSRPLRRSLEEKPVGGPIGGKPLERKMRREGQRDYISVQDGMKLPPALWSSGQQESLPLVFILQRFSAAHCPRPPEPGSSLRSLKRTFSPTSQRKMVELTSLAFNSARGELALFVTTHSPYVTQH